MARIDRGIDSICYFCEKVPAGETVYCPNPRGEVACSTCWDTFCTQVRELSAILPLHHVKHLASPRLGKRLRPGQGRT